MILRSLACKKAAIATKGSIARSTTGPKGLVTLSSSKNPSSRENEKAVSKSVDRRPGSLFCPYTSVSEAKRHRRAQERDTLISVLESSATKRDAKAYLKTFGAAVTAGKEKTPELSRDDNGLDPNRQEPTGGAEGVVEDIPRVAVIKLRRPQDWDDAVLEGVAKTVARLNYLGLPSLIVLECDLKKHRRSTFVELRQVIERQMIRISTEIGRYSGTAAKFMSSVLTKTAETDSTSPVSSNCLVVDQERAILSALRASQLLIVPALVINEDLVEEIGDANEVVFALVRFLSGFQFTKPSPDARTGYGHSRKAWVDRVIIIDPVGGIPSKSKGHGVHVFVNLEDEFEDIERSLAQQWDTVHQVRPDVAKETSATGTNARKHWENLKLAKSVLSILPSTSSVVITSPNEAANMETKSEPLGMVGTVQTRQRQNPLIHNLLTDRPVYSSSLPIGRISSPNQEQAISETRISATTLAKRGLPVTIFPDPRVTAWAPPKPGTPRLRLTDTCIDLPRLIHLIDDSFNRNLDIDHYLKRVNDSLAGIIIAGEYEGGAILTWEKPHELDDETAYNEGRFVPYLDKFAVLKKNQGAGGVADIVFNAMVRECFPHGVCWRSRKNNPVNKWYFERSQGAEKLVDSNWAMFWTTPNVRTSDILDDYEDVCRNVMPSWKDKKPIVD